jgi:uroporphyrinogen decarboxylase
MMKHEPNFDRLKTALTGGKPDRVPLYDSPRGLFMDKFMGKPVKTLTDIIEFRLAAGYDYMSTRTDIDFKGGAAPKEGVRMGVDYDGSAREWAPEGEGIITTWADFEKHRWPKPEDIDYSEPLEAAKLLPDGMKIIEGRGHIFTGVTHLMGFETFSMAIFEQPDLVAAMFDKVGSTVYNLFENLTSMDAVGALHFNDDLAYKKGPLVSPSVYRQYQFPWMKKIIALCHSRGKPFIFHTDGNNAKLLDDFLEIGVDALHPIDPTGMDIRATRAALGTRVCLLGNINQTYPLGLGTPEEVEYEALLLLRDIAPSGAYAMGSGHSVQEYVPVENFKAMIGTAFKWGKYPIDIPDRVINEAEQRAEAARAKAQARG